VIPAAKPNPPSGAAAAASGTAFRRRLARPIETERSWTPDHEAMVAALRVVLGLPRQLPDRGRGGVR
jgi:hypothetical protein